MLRHEISKAEIVLEYKYPVVGRQTFRSSPLIVKTGNLHKIKNQKEPGSSLSDQQNLFQRDKLS